MSEYQKEYKQNEEKFLKEKAKDFGLQSSHAEIFMKRFKIDNVNLSNTELSLR